MSKTNTCYIAFTFNGANHIMHIDETDIIQMLDDILTSGDEYAKEYHQAILDGEYVTEDRLWAALKTSPLGYTMKAYAKIKSIR